MFAENGIAPITLAEFKGSGITKCTIERYLYTEKEHGYSNDRLNRLVERVIPTLATVSEVLELIDSLPKSYKANRRLFELAIRLDEKKEKNGA